MPLVCVQIAAGTTRVFTYNRPDGLTNPQLLNKQSWSQENQKNSNTDVVHYFTEAKNHVKLIFHHYCQNLNCVSFLNAVFDFVLLSRTEISAWIKLQRHMNEIWSQRLIQTFNFLQLADFYIFYEMCSAQRSTIWSLCEDAGEVHVSNVFYDEHRQTTAAQRRGRTPLTPIKNSHHIFGSNDIIHLIHV